MRALSAQEQVRRRRAYEKAPNDVEAARMLGVSRDVFRMWRVREGVHVKKPNGLSRAEHARRYGAYCAAKTDKEAARLLSMKTAAFRAWREQSGIKPKIADRLRLRVNAYEVARTDGEAARMAGITASRFKVWRQERGLPAKHPPHCLPRQSDEARRRAYDPDLHDEISARALGIPRASFKGWRQSRGLPPGGLPKNWVKPKEETRRYRAWERSGSDREAAEWLHMKLPAYQTWRISRGLAAPRARGPLLTPEQIQARYRAYKKARSDEHAGRLVGVTAGTFSLWRRKEGLPAKQPKRPPSPCRR